MCLIRPRHQLRLSKVHQAEHNFSLDGCKPEKFMVYIEVTHHTLAPDPWQHGVDKCRDETPAEPKTTLLAARSGDAA